MGDARSVQDFLTSQRNGASSARALLASGSYYYKAFLSDSDEQILQLHPRFSMGIENVGRSGVLQMGLCWWISRFHRAAAYLVEFDPESPRPSSREAERLIRRLTHFHPVRIPGFHSLADFTFSFKDELEKALTDWQLRTSLLRPDIALSTLQSHRLPDSERNAELEWRLAALIEDMAATPRPIFMLLDHRSIGIHSIVVLGFTRDSDGSVHLRAIDGNEMGDVVEWRVRDRDGDFKLNWLFGSNSYFMFRQYFEKDFERIETNLRKHCGPGYRLR